MKKFLKVVGIVFGSLVALVFAFAMWGAWLNHNDAETMARNKAHADKVAAVHAAAVAAAASAAAVAKPATVAAAVHKKTEAEYQAEAKAAAAKILAERRESEGPTKAIAGARAIRNAARDPDSVKFRGVWIMTSGAVCFDVVATNAFGGPARMFAIIPPNSTRIYDGDAAREHGYNKYCANQDGTDYTYMATHMSQ